jgi:hypothetical protein
MTDDAEARTEEMIAAIRAAPVSKHSPEVQAQLKAFAEDYRNTLYATLLREVERWLQEHAGTPDEFEAAFRHAVGDLVYIAAFVLRALKQRLGEEISPAVFARYCYVTAEDVLRLERFEAEAWDAFADAFDPRPLPPIDDLVDEVKPLILALLSTAPKPVGRHTIQRHVMEHHAATGHRGFKSRSFAYGAVLEAMVRRGELIHFKGRYSLVGAGVDTNASQPPVRSVPIVSEVAEARQVFIPEETIGEGSQCVYVYFNEAERRLAKHEGRDWWPCKIGFTSQSCLTDRLIAQRPGTSIGRPPVVGLLIKTDDGRGLERSLHLALDRVATRIDDAVGAEWFDTSPQKIMEWYTAYQQSLGVLQRK